MKPFNKLGSNAYFACSELTSDDVIIEKKKGRIMEVHSHTRSNLKSIDLRKIAMSSYKARNLGKYRVLDPYRH